MLIRVCIRCVIALFETHFDTHRLRDFESLTRELDEYGPEDEDPVACRIADDLGAADTEGYDVSKVAFAELKKVLPRLTRSTQTEILLEVSPSGFVHTMGL